MCPCSVPWLWAEVNNEHWKLPLTPAPVSRSEDGSGLGGSGGANTSCSAPGAWDEPWVTDFYGTESSVTHNCTVANKLTCLSLRISSGDSLGDGRWVTNLNKNPPISGVQKNIMIRNIFVCVCVPLVLTTYALVPTDTLCSLRCEIFPPTDYHPCSRPA